MSEHHEAKGAGSSRYTQAKASVTIGPSGYAHVRAHVKHPSEGWNESQLVIAARLGGLKQPTSQWEALAALWDCLGMWLWDGKPPPPDLTLVPNE